MLEKVKEIFKNYVENENVEITINSSFNDDLGLDSLDLFELVTSIEDEYSIEIESEELSHLDTVGKIVSYLESKGVTA